MALGRGYSPEQMYIIAHAESLPQWRHLPTKSETQLERAEGGFWGRLPSGFPLITPAEHTRRNAKPWGGILIKMSPFSVGHCGSHHF